MATKQLSDGGPDGTVMGQDASDLVGFFGATPVAKQTSSDLPNAGTSSLDVVSSTYATTAGLSTSEGAEAVIAAINAMAHALADYGLLSS